MKKIISIELLHNKRYRVVFSDTSDTDPSKTHTMTVDETYMVSLQKQTSLLLLLDMVLPVHDRNTVVQQIDEILDLEATISFNSGIDAHNG